MDRSTLLSTSGFAALCGVTRQTIARRVSEGRLTPYAVLDNGVFVFTPGQADAEAEVEE